MDSASSVSTPSAELDVPRLGEVPHGDAGDLEPNADPPVDQLLVVGEQSDERGPDVAAAEDPDLHVCHPVSLARGPFGLIRHVLLIGTSGTD